MKKLLLIVTGLLFTIGLGSSVNAVHRRPTGLIYHNASKAYDGYTLFSPMYGTSTYLIDMNGQVLHTWDLPAGYTGFNNHGYLMQNGNLLRAVRKDDETDTYLQEVDWNNNIVWSLYTVFEADHVVGKDSEGNDVTLGAPLYQHRDFKRIWNSQLGEYTTMYIAYESHTEEEAYAHGAFKSLNTEVKGGKGSTETSSQYSNITVCGVVEVNSAGEIIWKWNIFDHLTYDASGDTEGTIDADVYANRYNSGSGESAKDRPGRIDINIQNGRVNGISNDWTHVNSMDYNPETGHVVINSRTMSEFYVIDHDGTFVANDPVQSIENAAGADGDILYRFGNPQNFDAGDMPSMGSDGDQDLFGGHYIHWLRKDLEDFGFEEGDDHWDERNHFLIFENGTYRTTINHSRLLQINPYLDPDGVESADYVNQALITGGDETNQIVWEYASHFSTSFFSAYISSLQRLPNGNTLVCAGEQGHLFEVTSDGEVVWEYVSNVSANGFHDNFVDSEFTYDTIIGGEPKTIKTDLAVFSAMRYPKDHPAFNGKELVTKGQLGDTPAPPQGFGFGGITVGTGGGSGGTGTAGGGAGY